MNMLSVSRKGKKKHVYKRVSKQTCLEGGKRRRRKRTTTEHTHTHRERERERERVGQNCFSLCFHTSSLSPSSARSTCSSSRLIVGMVAPGFEAASACSRSFFPFPAPSSIYERKKKGRVDELGGPYARDAEAVLRQTQSVLASTVQQTFELKES